MYSLMVVEDEAIIRKGIVTGIDWAALNIQVTLEAANGKAALRALDAARQTDALPDIMLVDIQMPIMNGLALMDELRQYYPFIKVIVLSGHSDFGYAQQAMDCGAMGYLLKPTQKLEIQKTFQRVCKTLDDENRSTAAEPRRVRVDPVMEKVYDYIARNYMQKITLESTAKEAFMNPSYFSTYFKQKHGESFKVYLTRVRMAKAQTLLTDTNLKVYDIAEMVGYEDFRYFGKLFKSITGKSTTEYRNDRAGQESRA